MWLEKSAELWTARVKPSGWSRFVAASPIAAWLCGWVLGEIIALGLLVLALWELLLPGTLPGRPATGPPSYGTREVVVLLFLFVWLGFWTVGGISALRALLALLVSEERLSFNPSGVTRWWRVGPLRTERHLARGALVDVDPEGPEGTLVASLASGESVELLRCGTLEQRREVAGLLRELFALARDESSLADHTPPGWEWERLPATECGCGFRRALTWTTWPGWWRCSGAPHADAALLGENPAGHRSGGHAQVHRRPHGPDVR